MISYALTVTHIESEGKVQSVCLHKVNRIVRFRDSRLNFSKWSLAAIEDFSEPEIAQFVRSYCDNHSKISIVINNNNNNNNNIQNCVAPKCRSFRTSLLKNRWILTEPAMQQTWVITCELHWVYPRRLKVVRNADLGLCRNLLYRCGKQN